MQLDPLVVHNYARALINVVQKKGLPLGEALAESQAILHVLEKHPQLFHFLAGPQFREEAKNAFITKVFKEKLHVIFFHFILLLLQRDRIDYLIAILEQFRDEVEEAEGTTPGVVTTAVELSADEKQNIQQKLEAFCKLKFKLRFRVEQDIIGGMRFKYADTLMDNTILTYLSDMRQRLKSARLAS